MFKAITDTIPVVGSMADPVAFGIVSNLARPGDNITGVSVDAGLETWAKRLQLLQELIPTAAKVGYLNVRSSWDLAQGRAMQEAARRLGISLFGPPLETLSKRPNIGACWDRCRMRDWMGSLSAT
jgi:putative ABC transport system substrate-binding protein